MHIVIQQRSQNSFDYASYQRPTLHVEDVPPKPATKDSKDEPHISNNVSTPEKPSKAKSGVVCLDVRKRRVTSAKQ
ncbi:hypothetical protein VB005_00316 [Metarhizium brunneum]